jgi:hypothetical protein
MNKNSAKKFTPRIKNMLDNIKEPISAWKIFRIMGEFVNGFEFLKKYETALKQKPVVSEFLAWYGRTPANQYEFFESVRDDELVHRNHSFEAIENLKKH